MENQTIDKNLANRRTVLPNSTVVLVLGILSLVFGCCYGLGLPLAIVGLVLSSKPFKMYKENPNAYEGVGNLKAGRVCSIIGLCISGIMVLFAIGYVAIVGTLFSVTNFWDSIY